MVLDEAYYEFADDFAVSRGVTYSRSLDYVREGRNVVVLRTFSKVHGLAGVRVGYGIAPPKLIARISRQRSMYCVSSLAQAAAIAAMEVQPHSGTVENNTDQAERLVPAISEVGYSTTPTWANFLYCDLAQERKICRTNAAEGIVVRPLAHGALPKPFASRLARLGAE